MSRLLNEKVFKAIKDCHITLRPDAHPGTWLSLLLPAAIIISVIKHPKECSEVYKLTAILAIGLLLTSIIFIIQCVREKDIRKVTGLHCVPGAVTGFIYYAIIEKGFVFAFTSGFLSGIGYYQLFLFLMRRCKACFSVGEAQLAAQALILFLYGATVTIYKSLFTVPYTNMDIATLTISVGLLSIGFLCMLCYLFPLLRTVTMFYVTFVCICLFGIIIPLWMLTRINPLWWIFTFLLKSIGTIKLTFYWILCSILAVIAINQRSADETKASTTVRKVFHLLAVAVFLPGLLYECTLLYLASAVVFGIFAFLELMRILKIPPIGEALNSAFSVFSDEKDTFIALSPLYLLVGISLPMWLHPAPCDIADSCGFYLLPLASGIITIGIGDAAASGVGSIFGMHKWPGTKKSVEGTIACVATQLCAVFILLYLGLIARGHLLLIKAAIAAIVTSLIEAKTTQVDNHTLPLIMYIIVTL